MKEIWNNMKNFENFYKISNFWKVYSKRQNRIMKLVIQWPWYHWLRLRYWNGKSKMFLIHRLVAHNFLWLDINNSREIVLHLDNNKLNNKSNNLKVWTQKQNIQHSISSWTHFNLDRINKIKSYLYKKYKEDKIIIKD